MTDLSYPQPPVLTAAHVDAMRSVCSLWPYVTVADPAMLRDILRHLDALLTVPVPTKSTEPDRLYWQTPKKTPTGVSGSVSVPGAEITHDMVITAPEPDEVYIYAGRMQRFTLDEWQALHPPLLDFDDEDNDDADNAPVPDGVIYRPERLTFHRQSLLTFPAMPPVGFDDWRLEYAPLSEPYESDQ